MATSYSNDGGQGSRDFITATSTFTGGSGTTPQKLLNGNKASSTAGSWFVSGASSWTGAYIRFDFGVENTGFVVIDEATYFASSATAQGSVQWQGSDDAVTWTNIGSAFTLTGGSGGQVHTELSGNTTGYRYYQMVGVSGNIVTSTWQQEIEFKIDGVQPRPTNLKSSAVAVQALEVAPTSLRASQMALHALVKVSQPIQASQIAFMILQRVKGRKIVTQIDTRYTK